MPYSAERKEAILKKMLPPHNKSVPEIAKEEGISEPTLYIWRKAARAKGRLLPDGDKTPEGWSSKDKFAAVLETAAMNEEQLGQYCRQRGLYPSQIQAWRAACEQANDWEEAQSKRVKGQMRDLQRKHKDLERENRRKEKALAEAAALLLLKKYHASP
jgi:transposase-like protein